MWEIERVVCRPEWISFNETVSGIPFVFWNMSVTRAVGQRERGVLESKRSTNSPSFGQRSFEVDNFLYCSLRESRYSFFHFTQKYLAYCEREDQRLWIVSFVGVSFLGKFKSVVVSGVRKGGRLLP